MKLYQVCLKVRTRPWHPEYHHLGCGYLILWIFAGSHEDAVERAVSVGEGLPFEVIGEKANVVTGDLMDARTPPIFPEIDAARRLAIEAGFAFYTYLFPVLSDESAWAKPGFPWLAEKLNEDLG